jgi:SAM-dependent methyltransferase
MPSPASKRSPRRRRKPLCTRCSIASVASTDADDRAAFWRQYQPGMRSTEADAGTPEFFAGVEASRYRQESHIAELVDFESWASADILEVGCGIGTDGVRFARNGANYTGIDFSEVALDLARRQFELKGLPGQFTQVSLPNLPFADDSFDLVYSFGVLHHILETDAAVAEIYRVLRPGGHVLVMLYNRHSVNYYVTIMTLRRLLAAVLLIPHGAEFVGRVTRERADVLEGHRELLRRHGWNYLVDRDIFLSHNTDGPGNPLSKVYTRKDARKLFSRFRDVRSHVRYLNLRIYPGGEKLARSRLGLSLERRLGWHLVIEATKPS